MSNEQYSIVFKYSQIQEAFSCSKWTAEILEKSVTCSELTIKTPERRQKR